MRMTNKKYFALALVLGLMVFISFAGCKNRAYSVNLFSTRGGWGYDILYNNKIIIHQPYMPAVNGQVPFADRTLAKRTGLLVVRKLTGHRSPGISKEEIKSLSNTDN